MEVKEQLQAELDESQDNLSLAKKLVDQKQQVYDKLKEQYDKVGEEDEKDNEESNEDEEDKDNEGDEELEEDIFSEESRSLYLKHIDKLAAESYANVPLFIELIVAYEEYKNKLCKEYRGLKPIAFEEQKVVYVKEAVLKALNRLIQTMKNYVKGTVDNISRLEQDLKNINEEITRYEFAIENDLPITFNNKLVDKEDILIPLSVKADEASPRSAVKYIGDFSENLKKFIDLALTNGFDKIRDVYLQVGFKSEESYLKYDNLPGFNEIRVDIPEYVSYIRNNITNFVVGQVQNIPTNAILSLNSVTINNENDLKFIVTKASEALLNLAALGDMLASVNIAFNNDIEKVKSIYYDVEHNKITNLKELGVDDIFKRIITFKLVIETTNISFKVARSTLKAIVELLKETVIISD